MYKSLCSIVCGFGRTNFTAEIRNTETKTKNHLVEFALTINFAPSILPSLGECGQQSRIFFHDFRICR